MGGISDKLSDTTKALLRHANTNSYRGMAGKIQSAQISGARLKYVSIICFTLAILLILVLNVASSYSYDSTNTKALGNSGDADVSTLANEDIDPASISISVSSYPTSSSADSGDSSNLYLAIPQGGGTAIGKHAVTVSTGSSVIGYELQLSSNSDETSLINDGNGDTSSISISTVTGTSTNPSTLGDRAYGYTLTDLGDSEMNSPVIDTNIWVGVRPNTSPDVIVAGNKDSLIVGQANTTTHDIYYGVNIQNSAELRAGEYSRQVVYTAIGELMPEPQITDLVLNSSYIPYFTADKDHPAPTDTAYGITSIVAGNNLSTITTAWVDMNDNEIMDDGEEVTNLTHIMGDEVGTRLTFEAPQAPRRNITEQVSDGQHDVYLEWSGGDAVRIENGWNYIRQSECVTVDTRIDSRQSDCIVDIDDNMIPVYYTGDETNAEWSLVADCTDYNGERQCGPSPNGRGVEGDFWYDYSIGQWANAVTLRNDFEGGCYTIEQEEYEMLHVKRIGDKFTCDTTDNALTPLGAAKEVSKWMGVRGWSSASANPSAPGIEYDGRYMPNMPLHPDDILGHWVYIPRYSYEVMRRDAVDLVQQPEDFKIKFETADTAKKVPVEGCSVDGEHNSYRVGCGLDRTYTNTATDTSANEVANTTWATHPAFTWMDADGNPVELNGIWVGKFETTGSAEEPTVLPNESHLHDGNVGDYYDIAQSVGVEDPNNLYGNIKNPSYNSGKGYHNISASISHMLKNSEWGAVTYLSASRYGSGVNKVQTNNGYGSGNTGKGPSGGAYNTADGQLSSTTNNVYGVYDMAGGAWEYVMGSYATSPTQSSMSCFANAAKPPYVDLYSDDEFTNGDWYANNDKCAWETCGGHALHETKSVQSVSDFGQSWGANGSAFVTPSIQWFGRGGDAENGSYAGLFYSDNGNGDAFVEYGFRVALIVN